MKGQVLKLVRDSLSEAAVSGATPNEICRLKDRFSTLFRRFQNDIFFKQIESELHVILTNQVSRTEQLERLIASLDTHITRSQNPVEEYLRSAFCVSDSSDLSEYLNRMVSEGLPVQLEPPWFGDVKSLSASFNSGDYIMTLSVMDASHAKLSTPDLFELISEKFEQVAEKAKIRPKIWVFPTIHSNRLLVALGLPNDLDQILSHVFSRINQHLN